MVRGVSSYVVLVEDNDVDADLIRRALRPDFEIHRVTSHRALLGVATAKRSPDALLVDLGLPDTADLDKVVMIRDIARAFPRSAVVVLTGLDDRDLAVRCRGVGAQEYVIKDTILIREEIAQKIHGAIAHKQMEVRQVFAAESVSELFDPSVIDKRLRSAIAEAIQAQRLRAETEAHEMIPTPLNKVKRWLLGNAWKIVTAATAVVLYLVDFRDRIRDYTQETEDFKSTTVQRLDQAAESVEHLQSEQESLKRAIIQNQILQVRATEQLQLEIRKANPRVTFPDDNPDLQAAKRAAQEYDAAAELFGGTPKPR